MITLILSHFFILRMRYIYLRYQAAKTNRFSYKKLNIVQMNMSHADTLKTNFTDLFRIVINFSHHKCDYESKHVIKWMNSMKKLTERLRSYDKTDRL